MFLAHTRLVTRQVENSTGRSLFYPLAPSLSLFPILSQIAIGPVSLFFLFFLVVFLFHFPFPLSELELFWVWVVFDFVIFLSFPSGSFWFLSFLYTSQRGLTSHIAIPHNPNCAASTHSFIT